MKKELSPEAFFNEKVRDLGFDDFADFVNRKSVENITTWTFRWSKEYAQMEVNKYVNCECPEDQNFLDENGHVRCAVCYRINLI